MEFTTKSGRPGGVLVAVGVRVGVGVGVQFGGGVGTGSCCERVLLFSLVSNTTLVESTVAVFVPVL